MIDEFDFADLSYGDRIGGFTTQSNVHVNFSYEEATNVFTITDPRSIPATRIILSKEQDSPYILKGKTFSKRSIFLYLNGDNNIEPAFGYLPISAPFAIGTQTPGNYHSGINKQDMQGATFDAISFVGGNLELLIPERGYKREESHGTYEVNPIVEPYSIPPMVIDVEDRDIARFEIFRRTSARYTGETIAIFRLVFNQRQSISRAFEYIGHMARLVAFLSMSQTVSFLKIETELDIPNQLFGNLRDRLVVTNVINEFTRNSIPNQRNYRFKTHVLDIRNIGDKIWNIFKNARNNDLGGCGTNMSVLPQDWAQEYIIHNTQIKNICTALEHEHQKLGLNTPKMEALADLRNALHAFTKQYLRESPQESLTDQDRSRVFSSIDHIDVSAHTQYQQLIDRHESAIGPAIDNLLRYRLDVTERPDMKALVKHRNDITHNAYLSIDEKVYVSALKARLTVYACVLERCGLNEAEREEAFRMWF
ncbi:MAG: hypothetical protein E7Z99_04405 [Coriobacteriaceae bacterium]|nr:hypothetical protein [Coriobacteriaceae bacterium]